MASFYIIVIVTGLATIDVVIQPFGLTVGAERGQTLYQVIREAGIELRSTCGGLGKCGKCRVLILDEQETINKLSEAERIHFSAHELSGRFRLACQVKVEKDVEVYVPKYSLINRVRLQTEGVETKVKCLPLVKKLYVKLSEPTLRHNEPDFQRLLASLHGHIEESSYIPSEILKNLPIRLRSANWKVTATVWDNKEILDVENGNTRNACYGLAVDLGTTKIASYLLNLVTGKTVAASSIVNPQIAYGEDVITRIGYATKGVAERKEISRRTVDAINQLVAECSARHSIDSRHIYEATMVGNTAMHHLLLGINTQYLALPPYVPAVKGPLNLRARELNLHTNPHANVHFLPVIAGFVGSDCVAAILATGLFRKRELCLLLDIGTNTEVVIGNHRRLMACSCASGPAFEGAHIKHGMRASSGAIEHVRIDPATLKASYLTIDKAEPRGLCGSGILDVIADMLRIGAIDKGGALNQRADSQSVRMNKDGELEILLVQGGKASPEDIVVTQRDVREIQLAKGAVHTGISILIQEMGITPKQIKRVYIAGAFGTYVSPSSAMAIGMIPDVPLNVVRQVGNAAGTGARMALISSKARKICEEISNAVDYVELAAHSEFQSVFVESLQFRN